jgi:hypothetical protein
MRQTPTTARTSIKGRAAFVPSPRAGLCSTNVLATSAEHVRSTGEAKTRGTHMQAARSHPIQHPQLACESGGGARQALKSVENKQPAQAAGQHCKGSSTCRPPGHVRAHEASAAPECVGIAWYTPRSSDERLRQLLPTPRVLFAPMARVDGVKRASRSHAGAQTAKRSTTTLCTYCKPELFTRGIVSMKQ